VLELDCGLEFDAAREEEFFSSLPPLPAVCLIEPREPSAQPYLLRTQDLRRRLQRLLGPPDPASKRLNLRQFAGGVRYRLTASAFEQTLAYFQNARLRFPQRYRQMMRLRPPAVLKVSLRNAYPRCYATRRVPVDQAGAPMAGAYYGPFATRKSAEAFAEHVLDFFKVRRCQIKIRRDPAFPGCIYSEMKMCLAPCFAGCSKEEYGVEVGRLVQFLDTGGGSLRESMESERERTSEELDFEKAGAVHKKIEKLDDALRGRPELARRIQDLDAVILQRTGEEQTIGVFTFRGGWLEEPFFLRFAELAGKPRSAEQILRDFLEKSPGAGEQQSLLSQRTAELAAANSEGANSSGESFAGERSGTFEGERVGSLEENLWLLARWYYSNPREGEIFFREKDWPYRKILRACSRLLQPPKQEEAKDPSAN
jgi:excinuclease ABC subunit C